MRFTAPPFDPHPWLRNPHAMTIVPGFLPRPLRREFLTCAERRLFTVAPQAKVLAHCHWQKEKRQAPTLIILHGLEGSSESSHVMMVAQKAFDMGMNAVRLNLRNCGGTIALANTLYNAGLSDDLLVVAQELRKCDQVDKVFAAGFSLGGNLALKAAGELPKAGDSCLAGVVAVSPSIELDLCVRAIERRENAIYERWFLRTLKQKIKEKARLFSDRFQVALLDNVATLRQFDDVFTAPDAGYSGADEYYFRASAARVLQDIRIPTLVIASHDDPIVPFGMFETPLLDNPRIELLSTKSGGHAGFLARQPESSPLSDRFWAENRIISFCQEAAKELRSLV